jgi:hypothetical protein
MRGLFVHIGLHKTGSSTIQGFLRDNERALVDRGYEFSSVGRGHGLGNIDIANSVSERRSALGDRRGSADTLAAEVRARPERTHVISAEAFETLNDEDVARLAAAFAGIPVTVVCYIRNTPAHIQSRYAQLAKSASLDTDFDAFFARLRDSLSVLPKLERWGAAFGWQNLVIASVDGFSPATPDLVHHFLGALGIADTSGLRFARGSRNVSPGWKTLEAARAVFSGTPLLLRARGVTEDRTDAAMQKLRRLTLEAVEAAAAAAWPEDPRTQYLTTAQWLEASEVYRSDIESANSRLPEARRIPPPALLPPEPRRFLPAFAEIPATERATFLAAFAAALHGDKVTRPLRVRADDRGIYMDAPEEWRALHRREPRPDAPQGIPVTAPGAEQRDASKAGSGATRSRRAAERKHRSGKPGGSAERDGKRGGRAAAARAGTRSASPPAAVLGKPQGGAGGIFHSIRRLFRIGVFDRIFRRGKP